MAYRKPIFTVTYHYDDDSDMYEMGEIDCGLGDDLERFAKNYGTKDLIYYLKEILPQRIEDYMANVVKTHICCDGNCNHDDCCGKVEANCPFYKKT